MYPLFDDKLKVSQMVFEACITIIKLGNGERAWTILNQCIKNTTALEGIKTRVELGIIPIFSPEGQLEFPHSIYEGGILYGNLNGPINTPSRFTSAGSTSNVDNRNYFDVHSAVRRPQTNFAIFMIKIGNGKPQFSI